MKIFNTLQDNIGSASDYLDKPMGLLTGFNKLDEATRGLHGGHLITIGGSSGTGKTSLMADLVLSVSKQVPVAVMSIEMGGDFKDRLIYNQADVNFHAGVNGHLDDTDKEKLEESIETIKKLNPICIDGEADTVYPPYFLDKLEDKTSSLTYSIESYIKQGAKVIFIDYLQFINYGFKSEREDLRLHHICQRLKINLAKKYNIPIVLFSQLKKEVGERKDTTPKRSDFRDSGFIETDSDIMIGLHRPDYFKKNEGLDLYSKNIEQAEFHILKNRNGPTGAVSVEFHSYSMSYKDVEIGF